jgi:hypothetical protein
MAEPRATRSLKRFSFWALLFIAVMWIIYALLGGPTPPPPGAASPEAPGQQP